MYDWVGRINVFDEPFFWTKLWISKPVTWLSSAQHNLSIRSFHWEIGHLLYVYILGPFAGK